MSNAAPTMRMPTRERTQDEFIASFQEMLAVMRKLHDLYGDPNIRDIITRAESSLGRVPR